MGIQLDYNLFVKYSNIFDKEIEDAIKQKVQDIESKYGVKIYYYHFEGVYHIEIKLDSEKRIE